MSICPACGGPHGQFVSTTVAKVSDESYSQGNTYRCTQCDHEWHVEQQPAVPLHHSSATDF